MEPAPRLPVDFGARVRAARGYIGVSQADFGSLFGMSGGYIKNLERGDKSIREIEGLGLIVRMADVTGLPQSFFLDDDAPGDSRLTEILELLRRLDDRLTDAEQAQSNATAQQLARATAVLSRLDDIEASIQQLAPRRRRTA